MDRLQHVELVRTTPMSHWKAGTVQAWLEVVMAMPMYVKACAENVKSGKVGGYGLWWDIPCSFLWAPQSRGLACPSPILLLGQQEVQSRSWLIWVPVPRFCQSITTPPARHRALQSFHCHV